LTSPYVLTPQLFTRIINAKKHCPLCPIPFHLGDSVISYSSRKKLLHYKCYVEKEKYFDHKNPKS
jgi:hypothetical protein